MDLTPVPALSVTGAAATLPRPVPPPLPGDPPVQPVQPTPVPPQPVEPEPIPVAAPVVETSAPMPTEVPVVEAPVVPKIADVFPNLPDDVAPTPVPVPEPVPAPAPEPTPIVESTPEATLLVEQPTQVETLPDAVSQEAPIEPIEVTPTAELTSAAPVLEPTSPSPMPSFPPSPLPDLSTDQPPEPSASEQGFDIPVPDLIPDSSQPDVLTGEEASAADGEAKRSPMEILEQILAGANAQKEAKAAEDEKKKQEEAAAAAERAALEEKYAIEAKQRLDSSIQALQEATQERQQVDQQFEQAAQPDSKLEDRYRILQLIHQTA